MEKQNLLKLMKQKAESVQAVVSDIKNINEAFQYATDLTEKQDGKTIAAPGLNEEQRISLQKICEKKGLELLDFPLRNNLTRIHTGLTFADFGVAETGTLVLDSSKEDIRIATMLSEIHVAILPALQIYPDFMSLEKKLTELQKSPCYISFISGASRTADIERILTIGVHGPQELHIMILSGEM